MTNEELDQLFKDSSEYQSWKSQFDKVESAYNGAQEVLNKYQGADGYARFRNDFNRGGEPAQKIMAPIAEATEIQTRRALEMLLQRSPNRDQALINLANNNPDLSPFIAKARADSRADFRGVGFDSNHIVEGYVEYSKNLAVSETIARIFNDPSALQTVFDLTAKGLASQKDQLYSNLGQVETDFWKKYNANKPPEQKTPAPQPPAPQPPAPPPPPPPSGGPDGGGSVTPPAPIVLPPPEIIYPAPKDAMPPVPVLPIMPPEEEFPKAPWMPIVQPPNVTPINPVDPGKQPPSLQPIPLPLPDDGIKRPEERFVPVKTPVTLPTERFFNIETRASLPGRAGGITGATMVDAPGSTGVVDQSSQSVDTPVYGPSGKRYNSVTEALAAGELNFTYTPPAASNQSLIANANPRFFNVGAPSVRLPGANQNPFVR